MLKKWHANGKKASRNIINILRNYILWIQSILITPGISYMLF